MRIGYHPNNLHLRLASRWPGAFADLEPRFVAYGEGRDTGRLLAAGEIDIGGTGSTPPILAAVEGQDVRYTAASAPRPANGAILVRRDGGPADVPSLSGQAVALVDGSFLTYFLARALEEVGLGLGDVERRDLDPDTSRRALLSGDVAAWLAMAPHLERSVGDEAFRVLAHCGPRIPNRSMFWTLAGRGLCEDALARFADGLARLGREVTAEPERAASLLAGRDGDEQERRAWTRVVQERNWQAAPAGVEILREQQAEADTLFRHGVLAHRISIVPETVRDEPT